MKLPDVGPMSTFNTVSMNNLISQKEMKKHMTNVIEYTLLKYGKETTSRNTKKLADHLTKNLATRLANTNEGNIGIVWDIVNALSKVQMDQIVA